MARRPSKAPQGGENRPVRHSTADKITGYLGKRVRQLRKERRWSLEELSAKCGVSRSMLSEIERQQANPTLAVTVRIAQAFDMSIGDFVETPHLSSRIEVIWAADRQFHYRSDDACELRTLSPLHLEKDVEFYELRLRAGGELRSSAHFEGTREFLTVEKGRVLVESANETVELGRGDSASYRADVPHAIVNRGRGEAVVFLVVIYK